MLARVRRSSRVPQTRRQVSSQAGSRQAPAFAKAFTPALKVSSFTPAKQSVFFRQFATAAGKVRAEKDTFGPIDVPDDKYWGAQTQR